MTTTFLRPLERPDRAGQLRYWAREIGILVLMLAAGLAAAAALWLLGGVLILAWIAAVVFGGAGLLFKWSFWR